MVQLLLVVAGRVTVLSTVFVTPTTFMLGEFDNGILPVREPSWNECLLQASDGMQMVILVSGYAAKAECKIFIFFIVKPRPSVEPLRLERLLRHWCLSKLTLGEAEGSWLVWLFTYHRCRQLIGHYADLTESTCVPSSKVYKNGSKKVGWPEMDAWYSQEILMD